jgi:hypothetical protein
MTTASISYAWRRAQRRRTLAATPRGLLRATIACATALAVTPAGVALAAPPNITITSPSNGSVVNESTPSFSGSTDDPFDEVTVNIDEEGTSVRTLATTTPPGSSWTTGPSQALANGAYTAIAEQSNLLSERGTSPQVAFTISVPPPQLTISVPANHSATSSGSQVVAGTTSGTSPTVTVHLYTGETTAAQASIEAVAVRPANGSWSTTFGGLGAGTYTAQAEQRDTAGNRGVSAPVSFTVTPPPPPPPPVASFKWFPAAPRAGEQVSLVSTSTDAASAITSFAWSLASSGAFTAGKPVLTTSFPTAGNHVVRLQVTDGNGLSSTATETIPVAASPLPLLLPVPIVRIAGYETASGVNISVLSVQAPVTAWVTVTCRGHGCPTKSVAVLARASKKRRHASSVQIAFRRFERSLPAGVILEIRVSKLGQIGKYTRFVIRRHLLPVRVDACLGSGNPQPIVCPS